MGCLVFNGRSYKERITVAAVVYISLSGIFI